MLCHISVSKFNELQYLVDLVLYVLAALVFLSLKRKFTIYIHNKVPSYYKLLP